DRARARHGAQCVLRLHRRARPQIHLAAGARRRVLLRRAVLPHLRLQDPRIHHQLDPEESQIGSAGVGLFLGIIALEEAKIVVANPATLVTLGDLKQWPAILCLAGFIVIVALNYRNVVGATLIGILAVTLIGLPLGLAEFTGIVSAPPSLAPTFLQLDF